MNKFLLVIVALAANAAAFTTSPRTALSTHASTHAPITTPFTTAASAASTSTALALKIKVDPDAKGNNNVTGNAKMAAYGGSVIIAVLLPVFFLIWSAVSH